jgi:hypothetical protein
MTVHDFPGGRGYAPPPSGGNGDSMERLAKLETRIETILPTLATKGDVSEAKASIVMWLAGVVAASTAIVIAVLAFMLNRAIPPQAPQSSPIIIYPQAVPQQEASPPASQSPPASKRDQKRQLP